VLNDFEINLVERLKDKTQRYIILSALGKNLVNPDQLEKKSVVVFSLLRLEYGWTKHTTNKISYIVGLFYLQRIIHNNEFYLF
jgi:hypothetical protein